MKINERTARALADAIEQHIDQHDRKWRRPLLLGAKICADKLEAEIGAALSAELRSRWLAPDTPQEVSE